MRRLDSDGRTVLGLTGAAAGVLLGVWGIWFFGSQVSVLAVSEAARVEVDLAPHPLDAPVGGAVVATALVLGQFVNAGDTLVTLDVRSQDLGVSEERARLSGLGPQLERLNAEIAEQEVHRKNAEATAALARSEAQARYGEGIAAADLARDHEARVTKLAASGLVGAAEVTRAQSEMKQRASAAETLRLAILRVEADRNQKDTELRIEIERLRRQAAELRAALGTSAATIDRLRHEGDLRRITAPVSGRLAEVANLRAGSVLRAGDRVATIVPSGALRVVADFDAAEAFGRVRTGQLADVRLDGFPFTQYGSLRATVTSVATELRDGRVRVELSLSEASPSVPLQHGLPGSAHVEVERLSPASLVLRAAGQRLTKAPSSPRRQ